MLCVRPGVCFKDFRCGGVQVWCALVMVFAMWCVRHVYDVSEVWCDSLSGVWFRCDEFRYSLLRCDAERARVDRRCM